MVLGRTGYKLVIFVALILCGLTLGQAVQAETGQPATTEPTVQPSSEPTVEPTTTPTAVLPVEMTEEPTATPSPEPTALSESTPEATAEPMPAPSDEPVATPTAEPSQEPAPLPTATATATSTSASTSIPEPSPSSTPSPPSTSTLEPSPTPSPPAADLAPPTLEPELDMEVGSLSGRILVEGRRDEGVVSQVAIEENHLSMSTDDGGNFTMPNVAFGSYSLTANSQGYLKATCDGVTHRGQLTPLREVVLIAGDLDDNGLVDVTDAVIIGEALGRAGTGQIADLNGDSVVNVLDLILVTANFGQTSAGNPWLCQAP